MFTGVLESVSKKRKLWLERFESLKDKVFCEPPKKKFKPKVDLPTLETYHKKPPECFWDKFPRSDKNVAISLIDPDRLYEMAMECDYPDKEHLEKVVNNVRHGAKVGCKGRGLYFTFLASYNKCSKT